MSGPSLLNACIYPLDGFMFVYFQVHPTVVLEETKAKLSVFRKGYIQPSKLFNDETLYSHYVECIFCLISDIIDTCITKRYHS